MWQEERGGQAQVVDSLIRDLGLLRVRVVLPLLLLVRKVEYQPWSFLLWDLHSITQLSERVMVEDHDITGHW